ncbi:hypothetical protein BLOT_010627 [Blomia tropicalis]|nr:hypothetical protein BLOT_010627 [Blomia tropicalis]
MNQVVSDRAAWSVTSSSSSSLLLLSSSSQVYVPPGQLRTCSLTSHLSGHCRSICQLAVPYTKLFIPTISKPSEPPTITTSSNKRYQVKFYTIF